MPTADDDFITVGDAFPQIDAVAPLAGLVVLVTWRGGKQVAVDLAPTLHRFKLYAPLRTDRALFETVHVANASTIAWGADDAIDMHVGEIERLAGETMDAADFKAWMKDLGLTLDSAAAMLGMSRRTVAYYSSGQEIPRYVVLACAQLADRAAFVDRAALDARVQSQTPESVEVRPSKRVRSEPEVRRAAVRHRG